MSSEDFTKSGFSVANSLRVLRSQRVVWILGSLVLAAAAILAIAMIPDEYRATTTILVDPQKIPDRYVSTTVSSDPSERLNTITQEVLSSTRLQHTIEQFNLYPQMRAKRSREEVIEYMRTKISIQVKQSSGQGLSSFAITFSGNSPTIVAKVANQLAATFIEWNLSSREQQAQSTTEFLDSQLQQAKQNLEQQEGALRQFKMEHLGETPDELPTNLQTLSRLQVELQAVVDALNRAETERLVLTRAPQLAGDSAAAPMPLDERVRLNMEKRRIQDELWDLQRRYTASHPDVQSLRARLARIESQIAALPPETEASKQEPRPSEDVRVEILGRQTAQLHKQQHDIEQQVAAYQHKVDAVPLREQQLTELTRNYEMSKQHYQSLLDKTFSAEMAADLERKQQGERFTILDAAQVPEKPYKPQRAILMVGSVLVSILIMAAVLIVKDMLNGAVKSEQQLKELLPAGTLILGSARHILTPKDRRNQRAFVALSTIAAVSICCVTAFLMWKIHPIF